jgi:two-component system phosphate regulon sensor histidine kinase PhoR
MVPGSSTGPRPVSPARAEAKPPGSLALAALVAVPLLTLAALVAYGALAPVPAVMAGVANLAALAALARLRQREYRLITEEVRRAALEEAPGAGAVWLDGKLGTALRVLRERREALAGRVRTEEAIVETLPDPLIVLAPDRAVLRANAAATAAYGAELPAVLRHPMMRGAIDRVLAKGAPQEVDLSVPVPVEREVHATVFRLGGGRVAAVLSDRTRERALERMRADFVANASHELRTPLSSLIGFIETLRGPAADDLPAQGRFLAIMAEQAQRMNRLIDDLLSLSRIELVEHQTPTEEVTLGDLLQLTADSFEPRVRARGLTLDIRIAEDLPGVPGDEDQLGQVVSNLLDNAIKYGREGGTVRLLAERAAPGGRWPPRPGITVAVADDGAGIAREHLPRLTERFYRVDTGRSRAVGGTGLGLAIVKHIVNRHRGQLVIDSKVGEGAVFTVWLPAKA